MTKHIFSILALMLTLGLAPANMHARQMMELIEIDQQQPKIEFKQNVAYISNAAGQKLYVYNVAGICVQTITIESNERRVELNLQKGCYILKVNKTTRKVSVK